MKIGIPTALYQNTFGIDAKYVNWVAKFGQPVLLTPLISQVDQVDALFLPGGADVATNLTFLNGRSNPHLEWFDQVELPKYIAAKKPIFGVCRGMQTLNIHFGGTLKNILGPSLEDEQKNSESDKNKTHQSIYLTSSYKSFTTKHYPKVNSIHHQTVDILAYNFAIVATNSLGNIEAIIDEENKIAGVQWHPEKIDDEVAYNLFKKILT